MHRPLQIPDMQQARGAHACTAGPNNLLYVVSLCVCHTHSRAAQVYASTCLLDKQTGDLKWQMHWYALACLLSHTLYDSLLRPKTLRRWAATT